jgi:vacuolar-type H+-ATPase subunit I/STV1
MLSERQGIDRRDQNPAARRLVRVGMMMLAMLGTGETAMAGGSSPRDASPWGQLMGENAKEREREIIQLERQCANLEARIANLEARVADETSMRYVRDPGLRFEEQMQLRDARQELRRKQAAIERLRSGMERGAERETERRAAWSEAVGDTALDFADPTLDLSPKKIGNPDIAAYYARYKISWEGHALYFDVQDGTPDGARLALKVGPEFTDADFFFEDGGKDLVIVFTTVTGDHKALRLDDGYYAGFYDSDARGKPVLVEIHE